MNDLLQTILRLDSAGSHHAPLRHLQENCNSPEVPNEIYQHLVKSQFLEAYLLGQLFHNLGVRNPVLLFAVALGGFLFGNRNDEIQGAAALSAGVDVLSPEQKDIVGRGIVHPVISQVIMADSSIIMDHERALRILEIYKAGVPSLRATFDWHAASSPLNFDEMRRQGRERAHLIEFKEPPTGTPRHPWRAIVTMQKLVFPNKPDSRLTEMGFRMEHAMNAYGWRASYFGMNFDGQDFDAITSLCVQESADILFLDDYQVMAPSTHDRREAFIANLRHKLPKIKIVGIHHDPWSIDKSTLVKTAAQLDAIWAHFPGDPSWGDHRWRGEDPPLQVGTPDDPAWTDPSMANKLTAVPFPHAGNFGRPTTPLSSQITFSGGVFGYNWHRTLWIAGVRQGLPLTLQMSSHTDDGLPPLESYTEFFRRVETSTCAANFSMRSNLSRIITGRTYETLLAGALLVQEDAPDLDYYLVSGEHYLRFSNAAELRAVGRFIAENPEQAEEIRRNGNEFARAHYNDDKLIAYLDWDLFYRK